MIDALWPWRGAGAAFAATLIAAIAARLFGWRTLASGAVGLGLAAGWFVVIGGITASPRQLPERLPLLAAMGVLAGLPVLALGYRRLAWGLTLVAAGGGAWWLAGAPMVVPDLRSAMVPLLAVGLLATLLTLALPGPTAALLATGGLAAGLLLSAPFGAWLPLAAALGAASLAAFAAGPDWPPGARLAPALGLAALTAGPVLARGSAADWLAAAVAPSLLWFGPALGGRLGGRLGLAVGWVIAGAAPLLLLWLLRRG